MLSPVGSCIGDITGDRRVDQQDINLIKQHFGDVSQAHWIMDINDDGYVDGRDLSIITNNYGCREW